MAPKKTTRKKAAKKVPRKPSAKSAKNARRASKAPKKVAPKKKVAKKPVARKATKKLVAKKAVAKKAVAKKAVAKKAVAKKPAKKAAKKPAVKKAASAAARYRDNAGHIDPGYAAKLREQSGDSSPPDHAFLDGPRSNDSLAEELGEETVAAMTTGEDESDRLEQDVDEDGGGPFVETDGSDEFADGTDESNPESATREPFPTS